MTIKISVTAAGREFELTPEEARALYDELRQVYEESPRIHEVYDALRKVYDVPFVSVPSVWTWPNGDDLSSVTTSTPSPDGATTVTYWNGNGQYTRTTGDKS